MTATAELPLTFPAQLRKVQSVSCAKTGRLQDCPLCTKPARTHTDSPEPVTYCSGCCIPERRFYRATASASARAWNSYARSLS